MPTEVYIKTTDDEGKEVYSPADWKAVEVPEEVVREHPIHRAAVQESISRRQKIQSLQKQLTELDDKEETPAPKETPEPLGYKSRDELYADIEKILTERNSAKSSAEKQREDQLLSLVNEHKLSTEVLPQLRNSNNPEELARYLGQQKLKFDDYKGGDLKPVPSVDDVAEKVRQKLNLNKD